MSIPGYLLFVLFAALSFQTAQAQYTLPATTGAVAQNDTFRTVYNWRSLAAQPRFNYKSLLIPAALIGYGVTGLKSDPVQDVNEKMQSELWTEHTHKQIHLDNYLQYAPAVAVYGLNLAGVKGKHNFKDRTIIYGMSELMMSASVLSLKKITKEERPDHSNFYSFPSGHTATAFAAAEFMRKEYGDVSAWYGVAGYAAALATGYLRLYNNKHWLSDVVAGAGFGILSTDLAYALYPTVKRLFPGKQNRSTIIMPMYQNRSAGLGAVHNF